MLKFGGWLGEGAHVTFDKDGSCKASPSFRPSDKLQYCLESTAKKFCTEQDSHTQTQAAIMPAQLFYGSHTWRKKGGIFPPLVLRTQNRLQAAEACEQPVHPPNARLTPCPYSWAVYPLFLAVGKPIIQVQTVPKTWLLTINFFI